MTASAATTTVGGADASRVDRSAARLGNSAAAAAWLASIGLNRAFARTIGLGLEREDERGLAIVHLCRDRQGRLREARHHVDPDGRVSSPVAGGPSGIWSSPPMRGGHVLVLPTMTGMWQLQACLGGDLAPFVAVAPSHGSGIPLDWTDPSHWSDFATVTMLLDDVLSQGALLSAVGVAAGLAADVATAPEAGTWAEVLRRPAGFGSGDLRTAVEDALPVGLFLDVAVEAERREVAKVDVHGLDAKGRAMRVVRIEERVPRLSGETVRTRDLVVRSDGMLLDVSVAPAPPGTPARDRVVTLSDGTRLQKAPSHACDWSLASVRRFVSSGASGAPVVDGGALLAAVTGAIADASGLGRAAAHAAAVFTMVSHVHCLFGELRVPVFHGGSVSARARLIGSVARLAHGGAVHSRARGDVMATTAGEVGGAILLDEPGPLAGPGGATEAGRFLLASCFVNAVWDRSSGSGPRTRSVFGPRAVFAQRAPCTSLGGVEVCVPLDGGGSVAIRDEASLAELSDRLHLWSMAVFQAGGLAALETEPELLAAFRLLTTTVIDLPTTAGVVGSDVGDRLDAELVMSEALEACVGPDACSLSITHLMMEVVLRGGRGAEFSPERIGRWLASSGRIAADAPVRRRRLHGHISRIYDLHRDGGDLPEPQDAFAFCTAVPCGDCRYRSVCEIVAPGMAACKSRRG